MKRLFDREVFFDCVRNAPFPGALTQSQVDGLNDILDVWEVGLPEEDLRWLAYALATTMHETASQMQPIEEYGKGAGKEYGKPDPETGQTYYGRGYVQLTWRENYRKADKELDLVDDESCEWHADNALDPTLAAAIMFQGMMEGWFRLDAQGPHTLGRYFNETTDNPYGAREIINGDKSYPVDWMPGVSIGDLIAGYHKDFLSALSAALLDYPEEIVVRVRVEAPAGVRVIVTVPNVEEAADGPPEARHREKRRARV